MSAPSSPPTSAELHHRTLQDVGAAEGHSGGVISEQDPENLEPGVLSGTSSTAPSSHIEPDVWTDDDEVYAESSSTSYLSSIASDVRRGITENGRTYGVYGIHKSWIPSDDLEVGIPRHCNDDLKMY